MSTAVKGRISHGRDAVPVPDDIRRAVREKWPAPRKACVPLGISEQTAYALVEYGGRVRPEVIERVRGRLG